VQAGCGGTVGLAARLPANALAAQGGGLAAALAGCLAHAHSRVRLAALAALDALVLQVRGSVQGICIAVRACASAGAWPVSGC